MKLTTKQYFSYLQQHYEGSILEENVASWVACSFEACALVNLASKLWRSFRWKNSHHIKAQNCIGEQHTHFYGRQKEMSSSRQGEQVLVSPKETEHASLYLRMQNVVDEMFLQMIFCHLIIKLQVLNRY